MIGKKYIALVLVSVAGLSAALSDAPASLSQMSQKNNQAQTLEERVIAHAQKQVEEVRKTNNQLERVVCEYADGTVSVRAHYVEYHKPSAVVKSEQFSVDEIAKVVVTHLTHDPKMLCLTTYSPNGDRLESKEVSCKKI